LRVNFRFYNEPAEQCVNWPAIKTKGPIRDREKLEKKEMRKKKEKRLMPQLVVIADVDALTDFGR
jgi:hypothetical protein